MVLNRTVTITSKEPSFFLECTLVPSEQATVCQNDKQKSISKNDILNSCLFSTQEISSAIMRSLCRRSHSEYLGHEAEGG